ncbi:type II toxin-antitoxin system RelE/ParE family toxin [uncultured Endozoicomonas sp.]|uniref:type II toxin-antitoxin system RelE/ParE family toxin n=1 Tax=uncultured Endozoicomonas sp. TaxID=432652 RepID=UPI00262BC769|nr:type II toxin-antitoxin system RelE/ParE family toxin [uncultured Endozoicomonas sp.]
MELIAETPALGKGRSDVGLDVLSFPQGSHVIYYVVHEQQIIVFGVLHKRMVPLNHLAERRKE